jgi:hypothetical protein
MWGRVWGNEGKLGENWGLGERGVFTQSPLIPKPLGGGNTIGVNKASLCLLLVVHGSSAPLLVAWSPARLILTKLVARRHVCSVTDQSHQ